MNECKRLYNLSMSESMIECLANRSGDENPSRIEINALFLQAIHVSFDSSSSCGEELMSVWCAARVGTTLVAAPETTVWRN